MTTLILTKQEAAKRLIYAAVAMFNAGADPLAMHIVASSAFKLLRDLSKVDGEHFAARVFQSALFHGAMNKLNGKETGLPDDPIVNEWVEGLARAIKSGGVKDASDIKLKEPGKFEFVAFKHLVDSFNFLKHADNDPDGKLDEANVKPVESTGFAITAYTLLFPTDKLGDDVADFLKMHGMI